MQNILFLTRHDSIWRQTFNRKFLANFFFATASPQCTRRVLLSDVCFQMSVLCFGRMLDISGFERRRVKGSRGDTPSKQITPCKIINKGAANHIPFNCSCLTYMLQLSRTTAKPLAYASIATSADCPLRKILQVVKPVLLCCRCWSVTIENWRFPLSSIQNTATLSLHEILASKVWRPNIEESQTARTRLNGCMMTLKIPVHRNVRASL